MRKLLVANWKENPSSETKAVNLFRAVAAIRRGSAVEVVVCPPFVYLEEVTEAWRALRGVTARKNLAIGTQDVFWEEKGAFTGEIGPHMVESLGARYVIVGHSERRKYAKQTDAMINKKIKSALQDGLHVILCVGESLAVRKKGVAAAQTFVKNQLKKDLAGVDQKASAGKLIIAYEPIWAIGTGRNDKPEDAAEMAKFVKNMFAPSFAVRFLYGGSVNSKNVRDYVQCKGIDGALVGGASLNAGEFKKIINTL